MDEGRKALKDIKFLLVLFLFAFAVYLGVFISTSSIIIHEVRAYSSCASVDDTHFKACYEEAKR